MKFYVAGKKGRVIRRFYPDQIAADFDISTMKVASFDHAREMADDLDPPL